MSQAAAAPAGRAPLLLQGEDLGQAALAILSVAPQLGARLRGPAGPGQASFLAALAGGLGPHRLHRMPANITDDRLLGGLDLAASLGLGRRVAEAGLLARADRGLVVAAMAERMAPQIAARLAATLDTGQVQAEREGISQTLPARIGVLALDEGIEEEAPPAALLDRLAFWLPADAGYSLACSPERIAQARLGLASVTAPPAAIASLVEIAAALGVAGLRAPGLALNAAKAAAALAGRGEVVEEDIRLATALVLAPRATALPVPPPPEEAAPPPENPAEDQSDPADAAQGGELRERVLEAVRAILPPDLLAGLASSGTLRSRAGGPSGMARKSAARGRPAGQLQGLPRGGKRLHLLATLRAAAPWQRLRAAGQPAAGSTSPRPRLILRREDFRIRRFAEKTRTTTIFVVDASGSAALHRLGEAKGAVELLLAECYVRRDRVALLAMRGAGAEVLLPPTSSLARAKKCLAALPGGGGTPIAAGIKAALALAGGVVRAGQTPLAVFLTDGRANIALDGSQGRAAAEADALSLARVWRAGGFAALLVDTAPRPYPFARALAEAAGAAYVPLPYADAGRLRDAVKAAG